MIKRCVVAGNAATTYGGGAVGGTLYDCQISGNASVTYGGGVYNATIYNCTVLGNASRCGGGVYSGTAYNSIVWDNTRDDGITVDNWNTGNMYNTCTSPLHSGNGNIDSDPKLWLSEDGFYRLGSGSPCVDNGSQSYVKTDVDLLGAPRVQGTAVDLGAVEGGQDGLFVKVSADGYGETSASTVVPVGGTTTITAMQTDPEHSFLGFFVNDTALAGVASSGCVYTVSFTPTSEMTEVVARFERRTFMVAPNGDDLADARTWATARRSLNAAAASARSGDVILVTNGVYAPIALVKNHFVTIKSVNGFASTIIDGGSSNSCAVLGYDTTCTNTVLCGFTLRNGRANNGGGVQYGTIRECYVTGNTATSYGGGMYYGEADNCVFWKNTATSGGGVYYSKLYGCSVYGNAATSSGGGSYGATAYNTIISGNSGPDGGDYQSTTVYSCRTNSHTDNDSITGNPCYVYAAEGDFRLRAISPCVDAGNNAYVRTPTDIEGAARISNGRVDIGAYEGGVCGSVIKTVISGYGDVSPRYALVQDGEDAAFAAVINDRPFLGFATNGIMIAEASTNFIWRNIVADGTLQLYFATNIYVDASMPDDSCDGFTPQTAKRTLRAAVALAKAGETIYVAEGNYESVNTGDKSVLIVATGGLEKTVIDGGGTNRCVFVGSGSTDTNTVFCGFTIRNGYASANGAGVSGGTFNNCIIENCRCNGSCYGGGAYYANLNNCLVEGNTAYRGGGAYYGTVRSCTIVRNSASNRGGGTHNTTSRNSIIWDNASPNSYSNYYSGTLTFTCTAPAASGTGNICIDPYFTDSAAGDWRLRQYSPCLDVGDNAYVIGECDLSGTNRIIDDVIDLGAFEGWVYLPLPSEIDGLSVERGRRIGLVRMAWFADEYAKSYNVYRSGTNLFETAQMLGNSSAAFYDDETAVPEVEYWYWVRGVNPAGEGPVGTSQSGWCLNQMSFGTNELPKAQAGLPYHAKLEVSGGSGKYAWTSGADDYDALRGDSSYLLDIVAPQGLLFGDDVSTAYPLPFDFPFYGKSYNKLWISSNGTLTFDGEFRTYTPSLDVFKGRVMIAPFWKDLLQGSGGVYVSENGDESVTFLWYNGMYYSGHGLVNASVTLFADGTILFSYGDGNANGAFVGVSAGDGTHYRHFDYTGTSLDNAEDIIFMPQDVPAGLTLSEDGVLSGSPMAPGTYQFTVFVVDDLGNGATRKVSIEVEANANMRTVQFDLGEYGTRGGGGDLLQYVLLGESATPPSVRVRSGWVFAGWSGSYSNITDNVVVSAYYKSAYPDLHVDSVSVPETVAAGEELNVRWTVGNTGNPTFTGTMTEKVALVSLTNTNDVRTIATVKFNGTIDRDGAVERSAVFAVPLKGWDGKWMLRIETAISPSMREFGGENSRFADSEIEITAVPLPNLVVGEVSADVNARPGESISVQYRLKNEGVSEAVSPWRDWIYLESIVSGSSVKIGSVEHTENLVGDGVCMVSNDFAISETVALAGLVKVKVVADAEEQIVESDETNIAYGENVISLATNLYLTAASESVNENYSSGVRFTVKRSGPTTEAMAVNITSDPPGQVNCPATVTIPAGNNSAIFTVEPIDNTTVEGSRLVRIGASYGECRPATLGLTIVDNEVPHLTLSLNKVTVKEGEDGIIATVTRELVTDQPLIVYLSGASTSRCSYPASVTIPAGEASVTFLIEPVNNSTAETSANLTLRASSSGFTSGSVSYQIEDDDVPGVTLVITPEVVSEGAGPQAIYATLTRSDQNQIEKAVRVKLTPSMANQLIIPSEVTIPKYTMAVRFAIGVIDNGLDEGDREVTIDGAIVIESCGCSGQPSNGDVIQAVVGIIDNDGPSLSLTASPATMKEGLNPAGYLTLSHNSVLDEDLTVNLWIDEENADELVIPETATIPAGQTSVRIPVQTLDDGVEDGGQLVSIYAEDAKDLFAPASTWVQVSDQNLPDLTVGAVTTSQRSYVALEQFDVTFEVKNIGFASRVGGVPYQVHIVKGASNGTTSSSTLVKSGRVDAEIAPDGVVTVPVTLSVPEMPADYRVAVILDSADEVKELDDANNTGWSSAFSVSPAYTATVSLNGTSFMPGETVTINGVAMMADRVTPAANVKVDVYVLMSGTRRNKIVTTDAEGRFSLSFEPSSGEAGHYTVGACYPGMNSSSTMATFDIMGIKRSSSSDIIWDIALGDEVTRTVYIQNRSSIPITGVKATITGVPEECELNYTLAETIPGNGSIPLSMTAKAVDLTEQTAYRSFSIHIDTDQGLTLGFPAYFHSQSQKAQLRISPTSVNTTMAIGHTRYLEFTVVNDGKGDSGRVTFSIPSTSWLRLVSQSAIDNLASGESATVTLEVSPTDDDNLVLNSPLSGGRLAVNCSNGSGCSASLRFTPVSESTGGVTVDVLDNSTYVLESAPHLANATVKVTNPYTGAVVASGKTDATGRWTKTGIPEGRYQLTITADKHDSYADELVINPGETSSVSAFVQSQVVSVSWTVEKTEIEDQYDIQLLLDFETSVPAPVVKTTLPAELPELNEGESYSFVITLENSGVIAAEEVSLTMPEIPGCEFQLSDNNIKLPAKSSRSIAAVIKRPAPLRKSLKAAPLLAASSNNDQQNVCWYKVKTGVKYICGKEYPVYSYVSSLKYGKCIYASEAMAVALAETWGWGGEGGGSGWGGTPSRGNGTGGNVGTGNFTSGNGSTYQKKHCDDRVNQFANANDELSDTNQSIRDAAGDAAVDLVKSGLWALVPFSSCIDLVGNTFASKDKKGFLFTSYAARSSWWSAALAVTLDAVGCGLDVFSFGQGGKFSKLASKFGTKVWKKALKYVNKGKVPKRELLSTLKSGKELLAHSGSKALSMFKDTLTKDIFKNAADIYDNVSSAVGIGSYILGEYETGNSLWKTITGDIGGGAPKKMMLSAVQSQRPVGLIAPSYTDVQQLAIEDLTAATVGYAALSVFLDEILDKNDYIPEDTSSDVALAFVESCLESLANNGVVKSEDVPADVVDVIGTDAVMAYIESFNQGVEKWLNDSSDDGYIQTGETDVDIDLIIRAICAIGDVEQYAKRRGYEDIFDMWCGVSESISQIVDGREDEICASVTLKLSQTLAMTREAFNGTLTLYNGNGTTPIRDLKMDVSILDEEGNECRDLFVMNDLGTSGAMSSGWVVDGGLSVSAGGTGSAVIQFIPSRNAAPTVEKVYRFGGTVTYTDPFSGEKATVKLTPVALTVSPSPYLKLDYFIQRDVYADDPMTEQVEASMPAEMAVLVVNTGAGDAKNVTISSVQPEIVKNEKGLDVEFSMKDYSLDATALDGSTAHLGLNVVTLGTIPAGESQVAQWWLTSSIQGHFTKMSASVTPVNSWNTPDTVLVNPDVGMHKLIRSLAVEGEKKPYFLTSENSDLYGTPDTIYDSNGASEMVRNDGTVSVSGTLIGATPSLTLTVGARGSGWNYVHATIPGLFRYEIVSVVRSDGSTVPNRNVWITDRTFRDSKDPALEERLHLADDFTSAGTCVYTVSLKAKPTDIPEVLSFEGVEDGGVEYEVRDEVLVVFTKEIDLATFTTDDIVLKNQGVHVTDIRGITISSVEGATGKYRIKGLSSLCNTHGRYELTVQCAGIADLSGQLGSVGKSVTWTCSASDSPYIVDAEGIPVRAVSRLDSIVAVTSTAVEPESFAGAKIMLNDVDVSDSLVVRSVDAGSTRFTIEGLESLQREDGSYTIAIDGSDLRGLDGAVGINTFSRSWTRDTVAPILQSVSRDVGMDGNKIIIAFSESVDDETVTLGKACLTRNGQPVAFPVTTKLQRSSENTYVVSGFDSAVTDDGAYEFALNAAGVADEAGNVASGSKSVFWSVDTTPPAKPTGLGVSSEYGSVDTVVQTCVGTMTISGVTPEAGVTVQIFSKYVGGVETLLATPRVAGDGAFSAEVNLPENGGNMTLIVRLTDASGNSSDTEIKAYYDKIALTAELSGAPELGVPAETVTLSFSDAVIGEDVVLAKFALTRNGEPVALDGVTLIPNDDGKTFTLAGLTSLCSVDGDYDLSFAAADVRKRSSGLKSSECAPLSWRYECPDREPPTIVAIRVDGEEARSLYTNGISSVAIEFSENVNIQDLAQNGLIDQALRIELLDADMNMTGMLRVVRSDVVCGADNVAWTLPSGSVGPGSTRIVVDAGLVTDLAGNKLAADEYAAVDGLQILDFKSDIIATVDSYAMPTWYDFDGDGLGDLVVGEKTSAGEGKVRVYRNVGSITEPMFSGFTYLKVGGSDLSVAASGCQGAQVAFGDLTGDGNDDLIVGYANGKVQMWYGTATRGTYGDTEVLVTGSEPTYGSDRAFVCPYDLDGDGKLELAIGGLDGKFRMFKYETDGASTESWLTDASGVPLTVAAGRSTPVLVDVNNDGCVDILTGDTSGSVWAFLGNGETWNATAVPVFDNATTKLSDRSRIGYGDVNGDGIGDLLVGRTNGSVELALGVKTESPTFAFRVKGTYTVTFDLGEHGTLKSGDLVQSIVEDDPAVAPEVTVDDCYIFDGWDVTFDSITGDTVVRAKYTHKPPVKLTVAGVIADAAATASHNNGDYEIVYGDEVTVAVPKSVTNAAEKIMDCTGWVGTGSVPSIGTSESVTARMVADSTVAWSWQVSKWWLALGAENGTLSAVSGWQTAGSSVNVTATPSEHYVFKQWRGDLGGCTVDGAVATLVMDRKRSVVAEFELAKHTVKIGGGMETTMPPVGEYDYAYGSMATVTVVNAVQYSGATQFVCMGWSAINVEPTSGNGTQAVFRVLGDTEIAWTWQTNVLSLAEAVNAPEFDLLTGGAAEWTPEWSEGASDGEHCAFIRNVGNNANAWMQTTVDGPGEVSFAWMCNLASKNTKLQFFVDDVAQGVVSGLSPWTPVRVSVYGEGAHVLKWRLFAGRSGAAATDVGAVDAVTWTPAVPPTLAEALNANLNWSTEGAVAWRGVAKDSRIAARENWAVASGLGDDETAVIETRVYGNGLLVFDWGVSCEEEYDWLEVSVDGEVKTYITGETGWTTEAIDIIGEGWHVVRWEYIKDEMDEPELVGDNTAMLDSVLWYSDDVLPEEPEKTATESTPVPVPFAEIDVKYKSYLDAANGDYEAAALAIGKNGCPVWESYVAGLDPDNPDSKFTAKIKIVNGKPIITWEPALNGTNADGTCIKEGVRVYELKGSTNLKDWTVVPNNGEDAFNFFKVEVSMPLK